MYENVTKMIDFYLNKSPPSGPPFLPLLSTSLTPFLVLNKVLHVSWTGFKLVILFGILRVQVSVGMSNSP